jgi:hypothetical protein
VRSSAESRIPSAFRSQTGQVSDKRNVFPRTEPSFTRLIRANVSPAAFYAHLVASWRRGRPVDVAGNISYLFCLAYSIIAQADLRQAASELIALSEAYSTESKVSEHLTRWETACFVVLATTPDFWPEADNVVRDQHVSLRRLS